MNPVEWDLWQWLFAIANLLLVVGLGIALRCDEKRHPRNPEEDEPIEHGTYLRARKAEDAKNLERLARQGGA